MFANSRAIILTIIKFINVLVIMFFGIHKKHKKAKIILDHIERSIYNMAYTVNHD